MMPPRPRLRLAEARLAKAEAAQTRIEVANGTWKSHERLSPRPSKALDLAKTGYDQIREVELMVGVKKEMVKDAQIGLDSAQHQLQFTQVRAPVPGVVVKRYRSLGRFRVRWRANPEHVQPGVALRDGQSGGDAASRRGARQPGRTTARCLRPAVQGPGCLDQQVQRRPVCADAQECRRRRVHQGGAACSGAYLDQKDDRWPLLRAGLSAQAVIPHGDGDAWAEQAAKDMAEIESRYNPQKAVAPEASSHDSRHRRQRFETPGRFRSGGVSRPTGLGWPLSPSSDPLHGLSDPCADRRHRRRDPQRHRSRTLQHDLDQRVLGRHGHLRRVRGIWAMVRFGAPRHAAWSDSSGSRWATCCAGLAVDVSTLAAAKLVEGIGKGMVIVIGRSLLYRQFDRMVIVAIGFYGVSPTQPVPQRRF